MFILKYNYKIMLVQDKQITETEILEIISERQKRTNVKYYSFEEAYEI